MMGYATVAGWLVSWTGSRFVICVTQATPFAVAPRTVNTK